ncbi:hypothetical protein WR25_02214 [Diploscapter pachys]|uniref:MD-2-related lipid-recognition domain-containing protein n=1 Tax=Diploscapter pachys TaxID=2018661 RepID=A0A2A2J2M9_9BILA|nr:hypothetical protein WR25_06490 [Diploscapter pachys]PAV58308.1 hypothetical protein WR25_02214 [Diploscapter pachys]
MMCLDNPSCPVVTGRQVIEFSVDPPPLYIRFFLRYFHDEMTSYQLVIKLRNKKDPFRELLCATIQTRFRL